MASNVGLTLQKPSLIHVNICKICEPVPETLFLSIFEEKTPNKISL
jgi:hypothetical protein